MKTLLIALTLMFSTSALASEPTNLEDMSLRLMKMQAEMQLQTAQMQLITAQLILIQAQQGE